MLQWGQTLVPAYRGNQPLTMTMMNHEGFVGDDFRGRLFAESLLRIVCRV